MQDTSAAPKGTITLLLLIDRRGSPLSKILSRNGYTVIETFTTDQAVAVCVNNVVQAVILDQDFFVETDGWSVAQSVKLIRPHVCVMLVSRAMRLVNELPTGVDVMVSDREPLQLISALETHLQQK
jgi:DNA-binding response OmpR family regulator